MPSGTPGTETTIADLTEDSVTSAAPNEGDTTMILRQDKPAANPSVRAGAANNETKDWLTQMSQHFRPLAQKADGDIVITAIKIVPEQNYAIIMSIGDPDLSGEPERNHGYITRQLDTVLRDEPKATDCIICYCGHRTKPMLKTAAVVAAACALGITLLGRVDTK